MSDKVRLAIIGCGGIANAHLRGYQALVEKGVGTFSIEAMCDVHREAAQASAEKIAEFQGRVPHVYDDVEDMLKIEDLNGADICTPQSYHHISAFVLESSPHLPQSDLMFLSKNLVLKLLTSTCNRTQR